jgi:hypothetical protein
MRKLRISRRLLASAPLLFVLAACDANNMTEPVTAPTVARSADYHWGNTTIKLLPTPGYPTLEVSTFNVVGPRGGRVRLGLHELVVPARAVDRPTRFVMTMQYGKTLLIDLTAFDVETGAPVTQFAPSVQLRLSYLLLPIKRSDLNKLVVVWLKDGTVDGELVAMPTRNNRDSYYLIAELSHFTRFAMGMN